MELLPTTVLQKAQGNFHYLITFPTNENKESQSNSVATNNIKTQEINISQAWKYLGQDIGFKRELNKKPPINEYLGRVKKIQYYQFTPVKKLQHTTTLLFLFKH